MDKKISQAYHKAARKFQGTRLASNKYIKIIHHNLSKILRSRVNEGDLSACWINYDGAKLYIDPQDLIGGALYSTGEYEPNVKRVINNILVEGDTAIDVGAHIGHNTVTMRNAVGIDGKVLAFEPHPKSASYIKKTIEKNHWSNVELIEKALSNEMGSKKLIEKSSNTGGSTLQNRPLEQFPEMKFEGTKYKVSTERLSDFLTKNNIGTVNLVKVDIEGAEFEVISDISEKLGQISHILLEIHTKKLEDEEVDKIYNILSKNGSMKYLQKEETVRRQNLHHGDQILWTSEGTV
jgi:FkbM family methyltransferase